MDKKQSYEDRLEEFEISLINQVDFEVEPLSALDRAKRSWHVKWAGQDARGWDVAPPIEQRSAQTPGEI
jgi:hypothetical protein